MSKYYKIKLTQENFEKFKKKCGLPRNTNQDDIRSYYVIGNHIYYVEEDTSTPNDFVNQNIKYGEFEVIDHTIFLVAYKILSEIEHPVKIDF